MQAQKKAPKWFTTRGLQLPKVVQTIIDANNSITENAEKINPFDENSSKNLPKSGLPSPAMRPRFPTLR